MPPVDSFSLRGMKLQPTAQIGVKVEFVHFKNPNWSTVLAFGTGRVNESRHFTATADYAPGGVVVEPSPVSSPIGRYLIQNIGLSYKHGWGKRKLQHTLTACAVEPIEKYASGYALFVRGDMQNPLLEGEFSEKYPHHKLALGLEYSPELLLHTHKRVFFGLGMVFNYSWGVLVQGRATVSNGTTTYYGGMLQRFSKIGITARMGFQGRRHLIDN